MINVGLIGYGYWGPNLARNLAATRGVRLAAIADERPERLEIAIGRHPGVVGCTTGSSLLAMDELDAVVIATPLSTHHALGKAAIERGKHVLVEKAMAASLAQAADLAELAEKHGVRLMVDHTFVYTGAVRTIHSLIEAGELGDVLYLDSVRVNLGLFQPDTNVIWDLAAHDLAIMDHLVAARPVAVAAHAARIAGYPHENIAHITIYFDTGFLGHFHVSWLSPVKIRRMLIGGSRRMIVYDDGAPIEKVQVYDRGVNFESNGGETQQRPLVSYHNGDMRAPALDRSEALSLMTREFAEAIECRRQPLTDAAAGLRVVALLDATDRSLRGQGCRVPL